MTSLFAGSFRRLVVAVRAWRCDARRSSPLDPQPGLFRWRQRRWWSWLSHHFYASGISSGGVHSGHPNGWIVRNFYRGQRQYILWITREKWGWPLHRIRYGHWPKPVFMGLCGICAPWPCCGATGYDHAEDCNG